MEDTSGLSGPGHYNKVTFVMRWSLSEHSETFTPFILQLTHSV